MQRCNILLTYKRKDISYFFYICFFNFVQFTPKYSFHASKSEALAKTFIEEIPRWYEKLQVCQKNSLQKRLFPWNFFIGVFGYLVLADRPENIIMKHDRSSFITLAIGLSVSLFFNLILIGCGILLCRYFFYVSIQIKQSNHFSI